MIQFPRLLRPSDTVGIIPPASKIPSYHIDYARETLESWGLKVVLSDNIHSAHHNFAGNDRERLSALQHFFDDPQLSAIFCARGGYGTSRIIDQLNLERFTEHPKWVIGFSDITIMLNRLLKERIASIHGPMPLNFSEDNASASLRALRQFLFEGSFTEVSFRSDGINKPGHATGLLIGGNLTMLSHSIGTPTEISFDKKILFIEEVDEKLYRIDRMIIQLKRAGLLEGLKGLIVGHFTRLDDPESFGYALPEIILEHTKAYEFPVCFGAPIGHVMPNYPMIIGGSIDLAVDTDDASIKLKNDSGDQANYDE